MLERNKAFRFATQIYFNSDYMIDFFVVEVFFV